VKLLIIKPMVENPLFLVH